MPAPAKLPPAAELRRIYIDEDRSLDWLAREYGVKRCSVYNKLARDAEARGLSWPLKSAQPGWRARACAKRWDSVRTDLLRDELRDCAARHGVTLGGIAARAGVRRGLLSNFDARVDRKTAEALVAAMDAIEREATGAEPTERDRRALAAEMRTAGYGARSIDRTVRRQAA